MLLEVNKINKSFGNKQVLKDISFQVDRGGILTLLGASGAGKTTILRCLNALEKCDSGDIKIDGEFLCKNENGKSLYPKKQDVRRIRNNFGMVFQNFNLFPHLSVIENIIEAPISVMGMKKVQAEKRAMELLEEFGLQHKAKDYPFELSGGQKQRVAIIRACILNPKIICFDEPTSALDPELRNSVGEMIKALAKDNMAVLIITHDREFAKNIAHRCIFVEDGRIMDKDERLLQS